MCRYAFKIYKFHYVCFRCKKTFKQPPVDDILLRIKKDKVYHELNGKSIKKVGQVFTKKEINSLKELSNEIENRTIKCPECSNLMVNLGKDFKAPKISATKEWKIIEGLYRIGKTFFSCGCDGIGYIPQNERDYKDYLEKVLTDYQDSIKFYQNVSFEEYPDKIERINYWSEKRLKIELEIKNLN